MTISFALRGHFVIPNSDDLLLGTEGCEDHAHGWGGSVLFTHDNGRWRISRKYFPGSIGLCRKVVNRVGRDGLVCYDEDQHYASRGGSLSFTYLFDDYPVVLGFWYDNMNSACGPPPRPLSFVQSEIVKVEFGQDERGDLKLTIDERCRKGGLSREAVEACERADLGGGVEVPYVSYQIQYRFDGEQFSLLPASTAAKHSLDVCLDPEAR